MTYLRTKFDGKTYYVGVNDAGEALKVEVMNVNGIRRTFWRQWLLASPRTRQIIAQAGAVR